MTNSERTLAQEVEDLKRRVARLETIVAQPAQTDEKGPASPKPPGDPDDLISWLKAQGLIAQPPPAAWIHARRWQALSDAERQEILRELDHLPPGPMVSDIVIENRR